MNITDTSFERRLARFSGFAGLAVVAVAWVLVFDWWFEIDRWFGVSFDEYRMELNAAVAFVLLGTGLWLSIPRAGAGAPRAATRLAHVSALLAGAIGLLVLSEHAFGWNPGIDRLLFTPSAIVRSPLDPARMAPLTALNIVLLATGLLLLDHETSSGLRPSNWLALLVAIVASLPVQGYFYGVDALHRSVSIFRAMSLGSIVLFVALSVGLVCVRPGTQFIRQFVSDNSSGLLSRRILPAVVVVPPAFGWLRWQGETAGFYSSEIGLALFILGNLVVFMLLAWWSMHDNAVRSRAEQALLRAIESSAAGLRRAQDVAQLAHVITAADGSFESWSDTLPGLLGMEADRLPRNTRTWLGVIHPDDRTMFHQRAIHVARTGVRSEIEYRVRRQGGWIDLRQVSEPLSEERNDKTSRIRWFNTLQDVTGQKLAEARIKSLNRVYATLSGINTLIVRAQGRDELFQEACRIAVEIGKFSVAWIGLIEDGQPAVRLAAWRGDDDAFFTDLQARLRADTDGQGVIARASAGIDPVVSNDVEHDADVSGRTILRARGSRSLVALPLVIDGKPVGVLVLHADVPDFFDADEIKLLCELSGDISFALAVLMKTEKIAYFSTHDSLTGLPNRRLFSERLSQHLKYKVDGGRALLAVVLVDLERFRLVNATLGRAGGDELLKLAATRLQQVNPSAACIGVDVFAFHIQGNNTVSEIARALDDVSRQFCGQPFVLAGEELRIGCRGGVAVFPVDGSDAEMLLRNAEAALHGAKRGVENYLYYSPEMNTRAAEILKLESKLRRAIERQEFVLHYQPKVNFADGRIAGVEALIRWQDPEQGLVPPGDFIPALEEIGLIGTVGRWALGQALADQRRWCAAGFEPLRVAVNVSPLQLQQPDFAAHIGEIVTADGGAALELEITESVIMEHVERSVAVLQDIRNHGVKVVIDDFGTGYCSLSYLTQLPVTSLKIDRSFVIKLLEGPESIAIVSSIITLAHALKLKVVAEGVETMEQARLLRLLACDEAQGYLYSRPVPASAIETLLAAGCLLPSAEPV